MHRSIKTIYKRNGVQIKILTTTYFIVKKKKKKKSGPQMYGSKYLSAFFSIIVLI